MIPKMKQRTDTKLKQKGITAVQRDNFTRSNKEKSGIATALLEKFTIL